VTPDPGWLSPGRFWAYSVRVYSDKAVAAACVDLQDRYDLDVNLLLFALFAASHGKALSRPAMAKLDAAVEAWRHNVVRPLRAVRRWLKAQSHAVDDEAAKLRSRVLERELESEALQQSMMERCVPVDEGEASPQLAADNLVRYVAFAGRGDDPEVLERVAALLAAACGLSACAATAAISGSAARTD